MDRNIKIVRRFKEVLETYRMAFKDLNGGGWVIEAAPIAILLQKKKSSYIL